MPGESDTYDFFVSYARRDDRDGWITGFLDALQQEHRAYAGGREFHYFFDKTDIRSLDDWRHRIYEKLAASHLLVAFISPAYFASQWCRREWAAWVDLEIAKHILSEGASTVYIVEVPWLYHEMSEQEVARELYRFVDEAAGQLPAGLAAAARDLAEQIRLRQQTAVEYFCSQGLDALREAELRRVCRQLAEDLDQRSAAVLAAEASPNTVPAYNKKFTGRLAELNRLRELLDDDRAGVITSIHGLGGVGKTELAFTYSHAFAGLYPGGRYLVPCQGRSDLRLAALALDEEFHDRISDEERQRLDSHFAGIRRCLRDLAEEKGRVLLVLDNVTDASLLSPDQTDLLCVTPGTIHLLATTRLGPAGGPRAGGRIEWLTLDALPIPDSVALLEKFRPFDNDAEREAAERIARRLGGFTLTIELVAAYLARHREVTCAGFLERLGLEELETLGDLGGDTEIELRRHNDEKRLSAVLDPTLVRLEPAQRCALEFAALLPPDHVVLPWLRELVGGEFPEVLEPPRPGHPDPWRRIEDALFGLALLIRSEDPLEGDPRIVRCHRLVGDYVRAGMDDEPARRPALDALVRRRDAALNETTNWQQARWQVEPLDALARVWDETGHPRAAWLLNQVGQHWHILAEWTRAETVLRRALDIDERSYGPDHPDVATALNNLAALLQATNRLAEAEPLFRRALDIAERSYGPDHPTVAIRLNNLALLLKSTNRLAEAEPLYRRALAIWEDSLGQDHPRVATALNNLAGLLRATNRTAEAEPLCRRALDIDERSYGPDHPEVATDLNNLAGVLEDTNRTAEAEPLYRRALAIDERSYGSDHPSVAIRLNNLALLLESTNRTAEAEPLYRRALDIDERSYGPDHPKVAIRLNNLAALLHATNRPAEAEPLYRRALDIREESYGPDHPDVAQSLNNLAGLLYATNRTAEAEPLVRRALAIDERSYGPDHPGVAIRLNNLAELLRATSRLAEAEPLSRRHLLIFVRFTQRTGHQHPHLLTAANNYAGILRELGLPEGEIRAKVNEVLNEGGLSIDDFL